jgi:hypothetical protein
MERGFQLVSKKFWFDHLAGFDGRAYGWMTGKVDGSRTDLRDC